MLSFFSWYSVFGISLPVLSVSFRLRIVRVSICWYCWLRFMVFVLWFPIEGRGVWVVSCGFRVSGAGIVSVVVWANRLMLRNGSRVHRRTAFLFGKRVINDFMNELYCFLCTEGKGNYCLFLFTNKRGKC